MRYYGILRTKFRESFAYRFDYLIRVLTSFISLYIVWFIWKAIFASSTGSISGYTLASMMTYMSLTIILNIIVQSSEEHVMEFEIRFGQIASYLIKPVSYPIVCFFRDIAKKLSGIIVQILPIALVAFFVVKISAPVSVYFLPSLAISYIIGYNLVFMTGLWAFWSSGHIWGVRLSRMVIVSIFSGSLIPIAMFPQWLASIATKLPFVALIHIPISIYLGNITGTGIFSALLFQLFWAIIITGLSILLWKKAGRKIFVQGG